MLHLIGWISPHCLVLFLEFLSVISFGQYFFVSSHLLCCKGQSLKYLLGLGNTLLHCGALCGGEVREGTMPLVWLLPHFQSLLLLPTSKLSPCGAYSWVGGFVYILGSHGSFQQTLLWGWKFLSLLRPPKIFKARGFEALAPHVGTLVVLSVSLSRCS